eukprot:CAMPEP_0117460352 /NCGR_PEP_ID=MMETSP0784-20121206/1960_1 /TAXON_ID=39447 /ORGANISM="" /LENGTH=244 /DNA_ID=CAMNT_0005254015 /DNA_START=1 /DNA_END=735 /DNA_ORIENTATION=-
MRFVQSASRRHPEVSRTQRQSAAKVATMAAAVAATVALLLHAAPFVLRHAALRPRTPYDYKASKAARAAAGFEGGEEDALIRLRPAQAGDMNWIASAVLSMVLSPIGLDYTNFLVAEEAASADSGSQSLRLGFAQLRPLGGSGDATPLLLASLFVEPEARRRGVGTRIVEGLLQRQERRDGGTPRPIFALTIAPKEAFFSQLGFFRLGDGATELPAALAVEAAIGRVVARAVTGSDLIVLYRDR